MSPGKFQMIDKMRENKLLFNDSVADPELVGKNIEAQYKALDEKDRKNFDIL